MPGACCHLSRGMPLERRGEFLGRGVAQGRMGPLGVVVDPPSFDDLAGVAEIEEPVLVEAFIAEPPVEGFDEGVLGRLAGLDEIEPNAVALGPFVERLANHLGTVVEDDLQGQATGLGEPIEHPAIASAGSNRSSHGGDEMAEAFGIACHELVRRDFRFGSTTDSEGCPQFRPLLGVQRTSISGGWRSACSHNRTS